MTGNAIDDAVLVLVEHRHGEVRPVVAELLTAARALGTPVGVWFGTGAEQAMPLLAEHGAAVVLRLDVGAADHHLVPVAADALTAAIRHLRPRAVLLASTFENGELATRVGMATGAGVIVDAQQVRRDGDRIAAGKTVLAGTWNTWCAVTTPVALLTLKPGAVAAEAAAERTEPRLIELTVAMGPQTGRPTLVERTERPRTGRPALAEAQVVVAGGRGTGGDFRPVEELADVLGAAIGATRDATDEGWIDHSAMIGQTGTTISPRLYIAAGISGAVHHRGGMQASRTVVAVNSDSEAPIFEIADFGVVGDLFEVLPQAAAALREAGVGQD